MSASLTPGGDVEADEQLLRERVALLGEDRAEGVRVGRDDLAAGLVGEGAERVGLRRRPERDHVDDDLGVAAPPRHDVERGDAAGVGTVGEDEQRARALGRRASSTASATAS